MEATCNNCNHWNAETPAVKDRQGFGACDELSKPKADMYFILPVIQNGDPQQVDFITGAEFGCNHFQQAGQA